MAIDAFEMALIHRAFRDELANLPGLIRDVPDGDVRRARTVAAHLDNMLSVLHHDHEAEDDLLWPLLAQLVPLSAASVATMQDQHDGIAAGMTDVASLRAAWAPTADRRSAARLATAVAVLATQVNAHLTDEEDRIVPLINAHITAQEWEALLARGSAFLTPTNVQFALTFAGFVLQHASDGQERRFLDGIPAAPRVMVRL